MYKEKYLIFDICIGRVILVAHADTIYKMSHKIIFNFCYVYLIFNF